MVKASIKRDSIPDVLEIPNYSLAEAVRYFHIPLSTVRYWTEEPNALVALASERPRMLSFKNLVEFYVLEGLRRIHNLKTHAIRAAVEDLLEHEYSRHPLADYELKTMDGKYLVFSRNGTIVNSSLRGQYEIPEWTAAYLKRVDRDPHGLAQKIYPFTKKSQLHADDAEPPRTIVIDPNICFGLPVLNGSRITTGFLASRYRGGDSLAAIADSYGRPVGQVKEAIEWETGKEIKEEAA
jgi:uncharacterized protein (DUF433 family)